jgi:tight adherence protein B
LEKLLGYATVFALTFLVTGGAAALAWALLDQSRPARGRKRVAREKSSILRDEVLSTLSGFASVLQHFRFVGILKKELAEAEVNWSVGRTVLMMLVAGGATLKLALTFRFVPAYAAWALAALAAAGPILYIRRRRAKRLQAVEEQLPEALEYLSRALVAGHSLPMSLELMADEVKAPLSTELRKTVDEYNLGMPMNDALGSLTRRVPSVDMQFFVSAVMTQSRTGGTLHEVLEGLAETIRERATLKGQVRAMTANGRMTALVLSLMPAFVAGVMLYINPSYLGLLFQHPLGATLVTMAIGGQLLAYFVIRKIVDIKV